MKYKILLVEDDKHFAYVLKSFLTTKGYDKTNENEKLH